MQSSIVLRRVCKPSGSSRPLFSGHSTSAHARRSVASLVQAGRAIPTSRASALSATRPAAYRSFQSSSRSLAEEVKSQIPFESNVMNLLANNEEFRNLVNEFADRMKELLNIDVHAGQMPNMSDMMRCAQDEKLQELSVKLTKILQADGVNLSPETLKLVWNSMQGKGSH